MTLVAELPPDVPAAVCVVVQFPSRAVSVLPRILERAGPLRAQHVEHGMRPDAGCIYLAPLNNHLLIRPERLILSLSPRESGQRPAIDPLFRSAAQAYGSRLAGVILSGTLDDGALGLAKINRRGGLAFVQDPSDAAIAGMPKNSLLHVQADQVAPAHALGRLLASAAQEPTTRPRLEDEAMADLQDDAIEHELVAHEKADLERAEGPGQPGDARGSGTRRRAGMILDAGDYDRQRRAR